MRTSHWIAAVILSGFLLYLLFTATDDDSGAPGPSEAALAQEYDYYMANVDTTHFRLDGSPGYRLQADRLTHYPDPSRTVIDAPLITLYPAERRAWRITAEDGRVRDGEQPGREQVELQNNVVVRGTDGEGHDVNIYTDHLTVYPEPRRIRSDREVIIESRDTRISSQGMTADLNANRIELLSDVQGAYEQPVQETSGEPAGRAD